MQIEKEQNLMISLYEHRNNLNQNAHIASQYVEELFRRVAEAGGQWNDQVKDYGRIVY